MAEGEELRTDYDPTMCPYLTLCYWLQFDAMRTGAHVPDYACYDEARTGFGVRENSSPPAIRERASLMVSVVFFAAM
jgi:hypothetical protein